MYTIYVYYICIRSMLVLFFGVHDEATYMTGFQLFFFENPHSYRKMAGLWYILRRLFHCSTKCCITYCVCTASEQ